MYSLVIGNFVSHFYTGNEDIVRMLVEHGADVNAVDADNNTALTFSIRQGIELTENKKTKPSF